MMLLPEAMSALVGLLQRTDWGNIPAIAEGLVYLKQAAIGLAMVLFLIFEPDGLAHRWQLIKSYWRLYPFSY
jgi:branched-chain amino acid transport system permease protein